MYKEKSAPILNDARLLYVPLSANQARYLERAVAWAWAVRSNSSGSFPMGNYCESLPDGNVCMRAKKCSGLPVLKYSYHDSSVSV